MNVEPTKMTLQSPVQHSDERAPQVPEEPDKSQEPEDVFHVETGSSGLETCPYSSDGNDRAINNEGDSLCNKSSSAPAAVDEVSKEEMRAEELLEEDSERERLKRHRIEVAGRVWIPDIWGQEELLKDWIDCSSFDASLIPTAIMSARAALVEEGRRTNSGGFRIENSYEK
ncbi:protein BIC1 isoform X2 [Durio zibethinus]|uniref:Protein BIC1 isoform X2 n=1 Tax=Durio zibethinus TaxID=66656 RepID=A0A6P6AQB3_DURZI|nr:protein BIC1 isoform X2 [Durio zibethinus]